MRPITILAVTAAALGPAIAWAQAPPPPDDRDIPVLEPVVVTVTRTERSLADQPDSVTVITREQIEQTPAQSLDDVLRTIPSVNLPQTASYQVHPTANMPSMRGLGGIRTLVLLDGVPINDAFFGYVQWNRVPMENVERVEVLRGGGSPLWGNYAMGGVINIVTRVPEKQEFGLEGGYGSYNTGRTNAYADLTPAEPFKLRANFNYWHTDGFNQVPFHLRTPLEVPTSFTAYNGQLTGYFKLDPTLTGYMRANYSQNDQTLITPGQTNRQWNLDVAGAVTKKFDGSELTATAFYGHSYFRTNNTETPFGSAPFSVEFLQNRHTTPVDDGGASVLWSTRLGDLVRLLSFGSDVRLISGKDTADIFDPSGAQVRTDVARGKQLFTGVFGQASATPLKGLELLLSSRFQYFLNYDGFDGAPGGLGNVPDKDEISFDPRLSIRYQVVPQLALRAAGYTAFRAPNLDNLYRAFSTSSGVFLPNSDLKPERFKGGEVGFDIRWAPVQVQVTGYGGRITDLITFRNLSPAELPPGFFFGTKNINAGAAEVYGVEAALDWQIGGGFAANMSYTYSHSEIVENNVDPNSVGNQQAAVPLNQVSAGLSYAHPSGWRASTRLRWVDKQWADNAHTLPIDPHVVVDASVAYAFSRHFEAFLDIQNLLDNSYIADNSGFNPPLLGTPFTAFGGLRAKF